VSNNRQGDYTHEIEARHRERMNAQPLVVACSLCEWSAQGSAGEVLELGRAHRLSEHGIRRARRHRSTGGLRSIRTPELSQDDRAEIAAEIARRRKLLGIEDAA